MSIPNPVDRPTLDVVEAGRLAGLGRSSAYASAHHYLATGDGLPVLRVSERRLIVPTARFRTWLGIDIDDTGTTSTPDGPAADPPTRDRAPAPAGALICDLTTPPRQRRNRNHDTAPPITTVNPQPPAA